MFSFFRRKKKQETPEPVEQGQNEAAAVEAAAGQPDQEERPSENSESGNYNGKNLVARQKGRLKTSVAGKKVS